MTNDFALLTPDYEDDDLRLWLIVRASSPRTEYRVGIVYDKSYYEATLMAHPNTYEFYYACTPYGETIGKTKDILWGFAPRLAGMVTTNNSLEKDRITRILRGLCHPSINIDVGVFEHPFEPFLGSTSGLTAKEEATIKLNNELSQEAGKLPGIRHFIGCPDEECSDPDFKNMQLRYIIIHLNDTHKWTRDTIADWLDKLYKQGVDLAFKDTE